MPEARAVEELVDDGIATTVTALIERRAQVCDDPASDVVVARHGSPHAQPTARVRARYGRREALIDTLEPGAS